MKKGRKKTSRGRRTIFLLTEIVIFFVLISIGYVMNKYGKLDLNPLEKGQTITNEGVKQEGYTTIVLFGGDSREGQLDAGTHADTMIIVSIDKETSEVNMVSIYRDLMTEQKDGTILKANSAYFMGGHEEAINMLNRNFDLDIDHYVTVDFKALADVIDLLGGIEVELTDAEAEAMNLYIGETSKVTGIESAKVAAGTQTLDGVQAVTYARIRKNVGGDYARTDRQRYVLQEVVKKAKQMSLTKLNPMIDTVSSQVSTSISLLEMLQYASNITNYTFRASQGFPFEHTDGNVQGLGSVVIPLGVVENVEELHAFLYPKDRYTVSQEVRDIAAKIETLSGYSRADYETINPTDS